MPSLSELLGPSRRAADELSDLFGVARPRHRPRLSDMPQDDLEEGILRQVREATPEDVNDRPSGGLQYALELLDLPRNVVANVANLAVGAEPTSKYRAFGLPKVSAGDLFKKLGWADGSTASNVGRGVTGFVGDIALDPLTYLTFGAGGILGSGARKIGQKTLTRGGARAVEAETAARIANLGDKAGDTLRELHQARVEKLRKSADLPEAFERSSHPLARTYAEQEGRRQLTEQVAEEIAQRSPEVVDRNRIGLTTRGLREFNPLELAYGLGSIPFRVVAPGATSAVDKIVQPIVSKARPFGWLPEADKTILEKGGALEQKAGELAQRFGLQRIPRSPVVQPVIEGLRESGRQLRGLISTEPLPPRPGDPHDAVRYEAERMQQFMKRQTERRSREIAYDEPAKLNAYLDKAAEQTGLKREAVGDVVFALKERLPSLDAGKTTGPQIEAAVRELVDLRGGTPEQAEKLAKFVRGAAPPQVDLAPQLPAEFATLDIRKARQRIEAEDAKGSTILDNSPLRNKLRQRWLAEAEALPLIDPDNAGPGVGGTAPTGGVRREKQAIIVIGPPASGKTGAAMRIAEHFGARMIDSDLFKRKIPEFGDGSGLQRVHEESSRLAEELLKRATRRGENVTLAIVGADADRLAARAEELRGSGYQTHLILWDLNADEAARRSASRFRKTGRLVLPEYILEKVADRPRRVYNSIESSPLFASASHYVNDVKPGEPARVLRAAPQGPDPAAVLGTLGRTGGKGGTGPDRSLAAGAAGEGNQKSASAIGPDLAPDVDLFGNTIFPRVTQRNLFTPDQLSLSELPPKRQRTGDPVPVGDGLRQMVAQILPTIPGKKRPDATAVRARLIEQFGSAAVHSSMHAGLRTPAGMDEIDEAIDLANKGNYLFARSSATPDMAPDALKRVRVSEIDTPHQSSLNIAEKHQREAWTRVKQLRQQLREEPIGGSRGNLRIQLMKAEESHRNAKASVQQALDAIELRANELGLTTRATPDLAPTGRRVGDEVEMVDSDLNSYNGKLQIIDEAQLLSSHRPRKFQGKVTALDADATYPVGFQARDRAAEASVKQVAGIAGNPRPSLLIEHGVEVTGGPPVVWRGDDGSPIVIQGNGRVAGMRAWTDEQWSKYRDALAERGYEIPAGVERPILVRELDGDIEQARKLAALGQESGALKQRRIEQAQATLNALGVRDIDQIPPVRIDEPISRDNVRPFLDNPANRDFREWLLGNLTPQRREQILAAPEELAEKVSAVFLASLPTEVKRVAASAPKEIEDMFVSAAPAAAFMHSLARTGQIHAVYDLHQALAQGAALFERMRGKGKSYKRIIDELDELAETRTFAGMQDDVAEMGLRGLAVAVGLIKAARSSNPTDTLLTAFNKIIAAAKADDPNQMAMFAIDSSESAARAYLRAFLPEQQAEALMARTSNIGRVDPDAVAKATTAPTRITGREQFMADIENVWATQKKSDADKSLMRDVLDRFSDDAFLGLRVQRVGAEAAEQIAAERAAQGFEFTRPAAAYYDKAAIEANLSAAEQAELSARGLIRLFEQSEKHTDFSLVLEEMAHHGYKSILPRADRDIIDAAYAAKSPEQWAEIFRARGHGAATHYASSANEWFSRQAADFVTGSEVSADPAMQGIFARLWEKLAEIWRAVTGRKRLELDPRVEAVLGRWYRKPESLAGVSNSAAAIPLPGKGLQGPLPDLIPPPAVGVSELAQAIAPPAKAVQGEIPELIPPPPPRRVGVSPETEAMPLPGKAGAQPPLRDPEHGVSPQAEAVLPPGPVPIQERMRLQVQAGPTGRLQLGDPVQQVLDYMQARETRRLAEEQALGVRSPELSTERVIGYAKRYLLADPKTRAGQLMRSASMSLSGAFQLMRQGWSREKFADEFNRLALRVNEALSGHIEADPETAKAIAEFGLKATERMPLFALDPVTAHVGRELESARVVGSAEFLHELARTFGTRVNQGEKLPTGLVKAEAAKFGDITREFAFPPEVAKVIESHVKQLEDPKPILRGYDWLLGKWKGLALISPAYHLRNLWGNVWNSHLVGAWEPRSWDEGRRVAMAIADGKNLDRKIEGLDETYRSLYRKLLVDHGLVGSGFFGIEARVTGERVRELLKDIADPASGRKAMRELREFSPLRANATLGQLGEEMSKIGAVIARMKKGDTLDEAVQTVKAALFDYGDLTDFERNVMRRIMPFYAWTRKNAELMLQTVATKPAALSALPKLQMNIEREAAGDDQLPPSLRPAHITKEGGIQISGGMNPRFLNAGYMLPVSELKVINPLAPVTALTTLAESVGGPVKMAGELAANYDTFFDRPIREYPGQTKDLLGIDVPPEVKYLARGVRPLNMLQQAVSAAQMSDNPASAAATIGAQALGVRTFPIDVRRQIFEREREINNRVGSIRRDIRRRAAEVQQSGGNVAEDAELRRLVALNDEMAAERAQLPLQQARALTEQLSPNRREKLAALMQEARAQ